MDNKLNLKKGEWYICHNTIFKVDGMDNVMHIVQFTVGKKYYCHRDGYLKNDNGNEMTFFHDAAEYFKPSDRLEVMEEIKEKQNGEE
jgi:hypothetical protein